MWCECFPPSTKTACGLFKTDTCSCLKDVQRTEAFGTSERHLSRRNVNLFSFCVLSTNPAGNIYLACTIENEEQQVATLRHRRQSYEGRRDMHSVVNKIVYRSPDATLVSPCDLLRLRRAWCCCAVNRFS